MSRNSKRGSYGLLAGNVIVQFGPDLYLRIVYHYGKDRFFDSGIVSLRFECERNVCIPVW